MKNALTIDVEDWYHTMDFNFPENTWDRYEDRIEYGLNTILELLKKRNVKATFFVLGVVAKKHPELIKQISDEGHEIGSHGSMHKMVTTQSREEFKRDVQYSKNILEELTGKTVTLYRSSSWSIVPKTLWALNVLEELGFECDSSIQPFSTPLSGFKNAPRVPYYPIVDGKKLNLIEFPPSVLSFGKVCFPFCGGLYLRAFPELYIQYALKKVNKNNTALIYTHPWEWDQNQPRLKVPVHIKFTHYYNLNTTERKMDKLLQKFKFTTLGEIIKEGNYPEVAIK